MTAQSEMVEEFICPGCVAGGDTTCGSYSPRGYGGGCAGHVCGTFLVGSEPFALGMPKGFNKCARRFDERQAHENLLHVRTWPLGRPDWNHLNVPVWALVERGHLFVRTLLPRVGQIAIDVVKGGTLAMVPNAINVAEFQDAID